MKPPFPDICAIILSLAMIVILASGPARTGNAPRPSQIAIGLMNIATADASRAIVTLLGSEVVNRQPNRLGSTNSKRCALKRSFAPSAPSGVSGAGGQPCSRPGLSASWVADGEGCDTVSIQRRIFDLPALLSDARLASIGVGSETVFRGLTAAHAGRRGLRSRRCDTGIRLDLLMLLGSEFTKEPVGRFAGKWRGRRRIVMLNFGCWLQCH